MLMCYRDPVYPVGLVDNECVYINDVRLLASAGSMQLHAPILRPNTQSQLAAAKAAATSAWEGASDATPRMPWNSSE